MFFINHTDAGKVFGVRIITSDDMNAALKRWDKISTGKPPWLDPEDDVKTINLAKLIADTRAKLTTLDIGISLSGSARADYLQSLVDNLLVRISDKVAEADRLGGIIIKPNGKSWDFVLPDSFGITHVDDDRITGAIFAEYTSQGGYYYTRLEYHRFEGMDADGNPLYMITNKAFRNQSMQSGSSLGEEVPLGTVNAWAHMSPEVTIANLTQPLFGFYRVPGINHVDDDSPLGLSVFANAISELKATDIAISRKDSEIADSKHITFVGQAAVKGAENRKIKLPRFMLGIGVGADDGAVDAIKEHVPTLLTDQRIKDINFNLSLAGVKCGFSEGTFVLDGQTGMITATQVEADDRDTIQTVKADRDALRTAIDQAIYAADVLATLYGAAPEGVYETAYNFGDITYNYEEDKAAWQSYVTRGWVPKWLYFVKFEGYSEDDAKALTQEAEQADISQGLFGG